MRADMSKKEEPIEPGPEDFQKRLQEMLRNANVSLMFGAPEAGKASGESQADTAETAPEGAEDVLRRIKEFNLKPREIRDYLDRFVIRQSEAKKVLAVAICDHYNHVRRCIEDPSWRDREYAKHNIVLLGPTGVGKTYLMRCVSKLIGVPYVKADATKFSETGYVGRDVEDLARDLVRAANGNTELAQYGIIYVDEIDKIASAPGIVGRDVSGRGVQINLLKLMEDTEVSLHSQTDLISQVQAVMDMQRGKTQKRTINTRHMLFVVSGAFDKLGEQVKRRVESTQIGFAQAAREKHDDAQYLKMAQTRDFVDYGFEPEFIGRLPIRIVCERLAAEDLEEILLKSEGSVLRQYQGDFKGYDIDFTITKEAVRDIALLAEKESTGARGLMTVFEKTLRNYKFELPSTAIRSFEVSTETVSDPDATLRQLLQNSHSTKEDELRVDIRHFAERFEKEHGFKLVFAKKAEDALIEMCVAQDKTMRAVCEEKFRDFQHGLTLIARNSGKTSFSISRKVIEEPGRELSRMIAESFAAAREAKPE